MGEHLTVSEVASVLRLTRAHLDNERSRRARGLPHADFADLGWFKVGRRVLLPRAELDAYIAEKRAETAPAGVGSTELAEVADRVGRLFPTEAAILRSLARRLQLQVVTP